MVGIFVFSSKFFVSSTIEGVMRVYSFPIISRVILGIFSCPFPVRMRGRTAFLGCLLCFVGWIWVKITAFRTRANIPVVVGSWSSKFFRVKFVSLILPVSTFVPPFGGPDLPRCLSLSMVSSVSRPDFSYVVSTVFLIAFILRWWADGIFVVSPGGCLLVYLWFSRMSLCTFFLWVLLYRSNSVRPGVLIGLGWVRVNLKLRCLLFLFPLLHCRSCLLLF